MALRDGIGKTSGRWSGIYTPIVQVIVKPAGDKGILANPVIIKEYMIEIMKSLLRDIYDMERGSAEVGFEHDLESVKFGILT